jgi:anti-sigma factor RsiW
MNDQPHHDEIWAEAISLLSAGCLSPEDERAARRHLESCEPCRERFRQLAALCAGLEASRPADLNAAPALAGRVVATISWHRPQPNIIRAHWRWGVVSALAASLLLILTLRSFWSPPQVPELAHVLPLVAAPPGKAPATASGNRLAPPTLFAYGRTFAFSSDATDSLLDAEARRLSLLSAGDPRIAAMKELFQ